MLVKAQGILWKDSITLQFVLSGYNAFLKVLCDPLVDKLYLNKNVLIHLFSLPLLLVFHAIYQRMNSHNKGFFFFLKQAQDYLLLSLYIKSSREYSNYVGKGQILASYTTDVMIV